MNSFQYLKKITAVVGKGKKKQVQKGHIPQKNVSDKCKSWTKECTEIAEKEIKASYKSCTDQID
jgi:hypothetical protein